MLKGWIALDIDGTITDTVHEVSDEVASFFKQLAGEGWQFIFITGRMFSLTQNVLKKLDFPYILALQNGADILEMPHKKRLHRSYLKGEIIEVLEEAYRGEKEDFIIYAGYDQGDFCYFRPARFSPPLLDYVHWLSTLSSKPWKELEDFQFATGTTFPLIKCLGSRFAMQKIHGVLSKNPSIHTTLIRDPFSEELYLNLVTDVHANKGEALQQIVQKRGKVIAAGDDLNDLSMLLHADVRIVMETAPEELKEIAHIIAPSAATNGIISALKQAIEKI